MQPLKIIVEKHTDGYIAYPLGLKGVVPIFSRLPSLQMAHTWRVPVWTAPSCYGI